MKAISYLQIVHLLLFVNFCIFVIIKTQKSGLLKIQLIVCFIEPDVEAKNIMLYIELERDHKRSIAKQIYSQIRTKVLSGELKAGEKLPSTRELSKELVISRNTVLAAYDMLVAEGFAYSSPCSGIYVNLNFPDLQLSERISNYSIASLSDTCILQSTINFDSGIPALDLFPRNKWSRTVSKAFKEAPISALGYDDPQGRPELRKVLCNYLMKTRGIICHPNQIIITAGAKQGLSLLAKCLLNAKSEVWLEDPSNNNVKQIFSYYTNQITPVEVDKEGIQPKQFPTLKKPTIIFVTPSHQFPIGGILSIQRRIELVQFAKQTGCYLVEDDYDSEFRYDGFPANSLFELDREHVIYVGTFSKVMFPSLRLGYLVVPFSLVKQIRECKRLADHHSNSIYQLALMRFIESGELEYHIMRMKKIYNKRRDELLNLLKSYFPEKVKIYGRDAGMHIVADFEGVAFTDELVKRLLNAGVYIVPVENHAIIKGKHIAQIILGYAQLTQKEMDRGLTILRRELDL